MALEESLTMFRLFTRKDRRCRRCDPDVHLYSAMALLTQNSPLVSGVFELGTGVCRSHDRLQPDAGDPEADVRGERGQGDRARRERRRQPRVGERAVQDEGAREQTGLSRDTPPTFFFFHFFNQLSGLPLLLYTHSI